MKFQKAPNVNGVMELTKTKKSDIKAKLETIKVSHKPSMEQPVADTFYLVSEYNKQNEGNEINGDTAEMVLNEDGS